MDFLSQRFAGNAVLEQILNDPDTGQLKLGPGGDRDAVSLVQQALWDLRWVLAFSPSTEHQNFVIGIYGPITSNVVKSFKQRFDIHFPPSAPTGLIDEFAGPRTLAKLDRQCDRFDESAAATDQLIDDLEAEVTITDADVEHPGLPPTRPVLGTTGVKRPVTTSDGSSSQIGSLFHKRGLGAFLVDGPIFEKYFELGSAAGSLGFPTTGIFVDDDGETRRCDFERGSIQQLSDRELVVTSTGDPVGSVDPSGEDSF
jgi:hypothetical protein